MKSIILITFLIASAAAEPQKTAGLERETPKSERIQFRPTDAQVYSGSVETLVADQVVPSYYGSSYYGSSGVIPGVSSVLSGVSPYASGYGQSTIQTIPAGSVLPSGAVYEHQGQSHIGHLASNVHVKRPGSLYSYNQVSGVPSSVYNYGAGVTEGSVQWINGQPAQWINGQWYYTNPSQVLGVNRIPSVNQFAYGNTLSANRPNVAPSVNSYALPGGAKTYTQQGQTTYWPQQPGTWTPNVVGVRPSYSSVDNKWYTKTNTQQIVSPFYRQPQYVQVPSTNKAQAVPAPETVSVVPEAQKNDW